MESALGKKLNYKEVDALPDGSYIWIEADRRFRAREVRGIME